MISLFFRGCIYILQDTLNTFFTHVYAVYIFSLREQAKSDTKSSKKATLSHMNVCLQAQIQSGNR